MRTIARFAAAWAAVALAAAAAAADLARGDAAWQRRAEGERDGRPAFGPISEAVLAYQVALRSRPESIEARWKLLRSLHFEGEFATGDPEQALAIFARAQEIAEQGLDALARRVGSPVRLEELDAAQMRARIVSAGATPRDVARLYFWSAVHWGAWSRSVGLLSAVRRGAADRIHRYALVAVAFDPEYDEAGPYRLLGSLHAQLPRVPFVSEWVDRSRAIPLLERAHAIAPSHPGNQLLLAQTLLELAPERRAEALALLDQVGASTPRASMRIEDAAVRRAALAKRARARTGGTTCWV